MDRGDIIYGGDQQFDEPEDRKIWDEKEREERKQIQEKFTEVIKQLTENANVLLDIVNTSPRENVGLAVRCLISEENLYNFFDKLRHINYLLSEANAMLDSYIRFTSATPDFKPINNLVYHTNTFMIDTQRRRFYQLWVEKEDKRFFKYVPLYNLVHKLSILMNRVCGTMCAGGNFIVDVGKIRRDRYDGYGDYRGRRYDGLSGSYYNDHYGGYGSYWGSLPRKGTKGYKDFFERVAEEDRRKKRVEPQRDIGDQYEAGERP